MTTTVNHQTIKRNTGAQPRMLSVRDLEAVPISATEWHIRDIAEGDRLSVLGFVRQLGSIYELAVAGSPFDRYYFAGLQESLDHLQRISARPVR